MTSQDSRHAGAAADAALVLIDLQRGFGPEHWAYWAGEGGVRNNPDAERVAGRVLAEWRARGRPVIHVRHDSVLATSPLRPGQAGNAFHDDVAPLAGEPVYGKNVNSAFIGTTLEADLRARGIRVLVMAGIQTNHCLSTSVRMAGNLGFDTYVIADAAATFDREGPDGRRYDAALMHDTALATLHGEFCTVIESSALLAPEAGWVPVGG